MEMRVYTNADYRNECIEDGRIMFYVPAIGWLGAYYDCKRGKSGIIVMDEKSITKNEIISPNDTGMICGLEGLIYSWLFLSEQEKYNLISCVFELKFAAEKFIEKIEGAKYFKDEIYQAIKEYRETVNCCMEQKKLTFDPNKSAIFKGVC